MSRFERIILFLVFMRVSHAAPWWEPVAIIVAVALADVLLDRFINRKVGA